MVGVGERELTEVREAKIAERSVAYGGFGQVEADAVIAELLRRFRFDGHAWKMHS